MAESHLECSLDKTLSAVMFPVSDKNFAFFSFHFLVFKYAHLGTVLF